MSSLKYWIWLSTRFGIGTTRAIQLIDFFGTPENIYQAGSRDYLDVGCLKPTDVKQLMVKDLEIANNILSTCTEIGCRVLTFQDSDYPERLRNIYDPPLVLYVRGNLPHIDEEPVIGVVGTRSCTPYGVKTAENVGYKLSQHGIIVVTGLALGVDTAAIRGALRGGTSVIGVIGSGLDIIYPPENKSVYEDVADFGAVISEYPPGTPAVKHHFPLRNRIISGISLGVAIIEAPKRSGALITAARALEQGRDVFVLPGNVDALSCEGSNALLREGAIPFINAEDIIDEYIDIFPIKLRAPKKTDQKMQPEKTDAKKSIDNTSKVDYIDLGTLIDKLDGDEKTVAQTIGTKKLYTDEIISKTGLTAQKVQTALTMLEIGGYILRGSNGKWEISSSPIP